MKNGSTEQPRIYGYARASTKRQVESPEVQKETIRKYAELHGLGDVAFFADAATSGKITWEERLAGKELFAQLRPGDHIIVHRLDRAFRRLADAAVAMEKFERMNIKFHVISLMGGALDLSSAMGKFLVHILAAFAELERSFISERTKDGLRGKKAKGFANPRFPGYGFRWRKTTLDGKPTKVRERDDEERNVMRSIASWRMQDGPLSWKQISDHLTYNLKLKTRDGGTWDTNRVKRACEAEFKLQLSEQRGNR